METQGAAAGECE